MQPLDFRLVSPGIGGFISTAAGIIAAGFGVAYNPVRMAGK